MARKASIKNLKKAADDTAARVSELEKQLEEAKAKQAEAQNKVREREKEIMQEENNDLAEKVRIFFGEDIIPDEFEKEMNELMLINEVREYIVSEREKRKVAAEKKDDVIIPAENEMKEKAQNDSMVSDNIMIAQNQ